MAERKWTPDQQNAIEARGGTLLVSAAAGSGKTAVLVERVIQRLLDPVNGCDADRLLVVTFTKAAAAEMRERISAAISARRSAQPDDARLLRQQMLLPCASICTIDSFCNDLVRENFHKLDLSPDYKILDAGEITLLRGEAMDTVLEGFYQENDPAFTELLELVRKGRDDAELTDTIYRLYDYTQAYPFPEEWIKKARTLCRTGLPEADNPWMAEIRAYIREALSFAQLTTQGALNLLESEPALLEKYAPAFRSDLNALSHIQDALDNDGWDALCEAMESIKFVRLPNAPKDYTDSPIKAAARESRDRVKDTVKKMQEALCANTAENEEDMAYLAPLLNKLFDLTLRFSEEFAQLKKEKHATDFSDIEHLALSLLIERQDGRICRSPLAEELSERYAEILVDEYQDTNEAQDLLFRMLSHNEENLFLVGDVKQSIYRFRQAMPEIFLNRRDRLPPYEHDNYPARITLGRNFRSRKGVTGMVNFLFRQLMSKPLGEMEYTKEEELVPAASYPQGQGPDCELHLLDAGDKGDNSAAVYEARYIAARINQMLREGLTVQDGGKTRPARRKDFCILLRGIKGKADVYVQELARCGVPAWAELSGGFFDTAEIRTMLSLMRILDNPLQDVPLLSVLFSPIYGFTPDDAAALREIKKHTPLYRCMTQAAKQGDQKCEAFLSQLSFLRRLSATLPAESLLRRIYEETGYPALVQAMGGAEQRAANLQLLLSYAAKYEAAGHQGLTGFIRFIDRLEEQQAQLSAASAVSESADVVRVMSIHKSKGLEFPVCILANCAGAFNQSGRNQRLLLHAKLGAGLMRRDEETLRLFSTIPHTAVRLASERSELSEELRVLYVALTRAREKLLLVMTVKNPEKKLSDLASTLTGQTAIPPFAVRNAKSYGDWLLTAALRHPDAAPLRALLPEQEIPLLNVDFSLRTVICPALAETEVAEATDVQELPPNPALEAEIRRRVAYEYPYAALSRSVAKRAASSLGEQEMQFSMIGVSRPSFLEKEGLTPAERGTALHKFMQFSDYHKAGENPDAEVARLVEKGFLSEAEGKAVDRKRVAAFFQSALAKRMLQSETLLREYKFTFFLPAGECDDGLPDSVAQEKVLVQGIADCVFVENGKLIIVDYKTDRIAHEDALVERYRAQLSVYRRALAECIGLPVGQTLLYSFHLGKEIECK